jgi:hypothetical protein
LLENGNILLFDNVGVKGYSRVLEFDPVAREIVWQYGGQAQEPFFSRAIGSCQRLPNGNTLITDSESGRAFEIAPDRAIVWEYVNPHRAGPAGNLIATLFEVVRIDRDCVKAWLPEK